MTRYLSLCGGESQKRKKVKLMATEEKEKIVCQVIDNKKDWGKKEEMEEDHRKIKEMVLKKFLK